MSYQTGTALDVTDLLDKWRVFLLANGWALDFWGPAGDGRALQVHRDGLFWSWWSHTTANPTDYDPGPYIRGKMHTSYQDPGSLTQPGMSSAVRSNRLSGPMQAFHFFAGTGRNGAYAHVVVETEPGTFRHFGMGTLDKIGAYDTGQYAHATAWRFSVDQVNDPNGSYHLLPFDDYGFGVYQNGIAGTMVRCDLFGISPRYVEVCTYDYTNPRARGGWRGNNGQNDNGTVRGPFRAGASVLTGRAPLMPLFLAVGRGSGLWSDIGQPPDIRLVRMDNMEAGQELALGSDTWVVFPAVRKNGAAGQQNSGTAGYAYRKVP